MRIVPKRSFEPIDELLERTENPAHRAMLENFKAHMRAEISCDLEAIMATMSETVCYHSYGREGAPQSREETVNFYSFIFEQDISVLELKTERISVGDWGISGDGTIHIIQPGKSFAAMGMSDLIDDESAHYLVSSRIAYFLPHDEKGLMLGEDTYQDLAGATITKLAPEDVVTVDEAFA